MVQAHEDMDELGVTNRILISNLLNPVEEDDVSETVSIHTLASSIVRASVDDKTEEEEVVPELTDAEKLKILANARTVLDSIAMITEGVDRQMGRAQRVLRFQRTEGMRQRCLDDFLL